MDQDYVTTLFSEVGYPFYIQQQVDLIDQAPLLYGKDAYGRRPLWERWNGEFGLNVSLISARVLCGTVLEERDLSDGSAFLIGFMAKQGIEREDFVDDLDTVATDAYRAAMRDAITRKFEGHDLLWWEKLACEYFSKGRSPIPEDHAFRQHLVSLLPKSLGRDLATVIHSITFDDVSRILLVEMARVVIAENASGNATRSLGHSIGPECSDGTNAPTGRHGVDMLCASGTVTLSVHPQ